MRVFLFILLVIAGILGTGFYFFGISDNVQQKFVCTPCGNECDNKLFSKPGTCDVCHMKLVEKKSVTFNNLTPKEVCTALNDPNVVALDVRTKGEFNGTRGQNYGHLKNALNIPIQELEDRIDELNKFKEKKIIVYCSHSQRSPRAALLLTQNGFTNVSNMSGGMSVWESSVNCPEWLVK